MLDRADVRHELLFQRAALLVRYRDALERADDDYDPSRVIDGDDQAEHWYDCLVSSLSGADLHALGEIIAALDRLDDGTYGTCCNCGASVDDDWLVEHPYTPHCPDCAVTTEIATLRFAGEPPQMVTSHRATTDRGAPGGR